MTEPRPRYVLSFDIDGTMEVGDPAGPLTFAHVDEARRQGHVVGTASDRTLADQRSLWAAAGVTADFILLKHDLVSVRSTFGGDRYLHIGDTDRDRVEAQRAEFEFLHIDEVELERLPWYF